MHGHLLAGVVDMDSQESGVRSQEITLSFLLHFSLSWFGLGFLLIHGQKGLPKRDPGNTGRTEMTGADFH
jgi:hypothetical protein